MLFENKPCYQTDESLASLTAQIEKHGLIKAPKHMAEEIKVKSRQPEFYLAKEASSVSKRLSLLFYSLKVSAAVAAALIFLAAGPGREQFFSYHSAEKLAWQFNQISNKISSTEVIHYDQKEK